MNICNTLECKPCTTPPNNTKIIIVTLGTTNHLTNGLYVPTTKDTEN